MARKTRKDCFDEIAGRAGVKREQVEDALDEIFNRAEGYEHDGMGRDDAYDRSRDEFLQETADQYARERRGAILDMRKESARHRYYDATRLAGARRPLHRRPLMSQKYLARACADRRRGPPARLRVHAG